MRVSRSYALDFCPSKTPESKKPSVEYRTVKDTSLVTLIANPEKYYGQFVRVRGYVHFQWEGDKIFLSEEDYRNNLLMNAVPLGVIPPKSEIATFPINGSYASLEGQVMPFGDGCALVITRFDWATIKWRGQPK